MKKYLPFCVTLLLSMNVQARESLKQFKNPMFNQTILSDKDGYSAYFENTLTPTFWDDTRSAYQDCRFITEDDKAVLLECRRKKAFRKDLVSYYLFSSKYKFKDMCRVWRCTYWDSLDDNSGAMPLYSKVQDCEGEESYDDPRNYPEVSCYEEITSRGWEKYLPESYLENLEKIKPEKGGMKEYLRQMMSFFGLNTQAEESLRQFKNPMFNQTILSDKDRYSAYFENTLTPTFWDDPQLLYHDCRFITEDDKAALLKCHTMDEDSAGYYLFSSKYKFEDMCRVWECSYWDKNTNPHASSYYSKVQDCEGEESYDNPYNGPWVSCYEEITSRGWEKYLPESYLENLERLKPEKKSMKEYLRQVMLFLGIDTNPKEFKNPMFNQTIWSDSVHYIEYIDNKLTPTFWGTVGLPAFYNDCNFVIEDDKAALLECRPRRAFKKGLVIYYLFSSKYKFEDMCRVWECRYRNFLDNDPYASPLYSKVQDCEGEESYDTPYDYPKISCYEEITSRGWEKYLPASYREKLEKLKPEKE